MLTLILQMEHAKASRTLAAWNAIAPKRIARTVEVPGATMVLHPTKAGAVSPTSASGSPDMTVRQCLATLEMCAAVLRCSCCPPGLAFRARSLQFAVAFDGAFATRGL